MSQVLLYLHFITSYNLWSVLNLKHTFPSTISIANMKTLHYT